MAGLHWKVNEDNALLFRVRTRQDKTHYRLIPPDRGGRNAHTDKYSDGTIWELSALYRRTLYAEDVINFFIEAGPVFLNRRDSDWPFHAGGAIDDKRPENNWVPGGQLAFGVEREYKSQMRLAFTLSYTRGFRPMYSLLIYTRNLPTNHIISYRGSYLSANIVLSVPLLKFNTKKERPSIKSPRYEH
ncbi:MAG: hypothetical protein ACK4ND_18790 [Cytophagaceae bacterium]